jgi:glucokinase
VSSTRQVFIGTDGGATTSKVGGVWDDGSAISTRLIQRPTGSEHGPEATVRNWAAAISAFLGENQLSWDQVGGVGLAIPGPYERFGVLGRSPNLPGSFAGFDLYEAYRATLADAAGRPVPLAFGNDGNMGGVAEAHRVRGAGHEGVVLLAPGSGLGCAFVGRDGLPLDGDTLAGMEAAHMPAPLHLLGMPPHPCGCGRTWGCVEVYTTLSGLPFLLDQMLPRYPEHDLARSTAPMRQRAFALRGLAQQGDPLACEIFDFQARALGYHVANLSMALDPRYFVIGGGLMDPEATTAEFRERYLRIVHDTAYPYLWPAHQRIITIVPATLGDLSQAIGAALVALYQHRG